jgi:D-beta-D-heptose 7-phosphate kinase / D-beta-D-heptose 1-phosphate adenosyltransferase
LYFVVDEHLLKLDFSKARVLVVGDVMLDRYWHGPVARISPEAPVPVVHVKRTEDRPGGAGNVALNIKALGAQVSLLGVIGDDEPGRQLQERLKAAGIGGELLVDKQFPTIMKLRVLSQHQQLIRLDFEEELHEVNQSALIEAYKKALKNTDIVLLSDYAKGTLVDPVMLIALAKQAKVPVFVDPKQDDFTIYAGADCVTPNLKEFEQIVGRCKHEADIMRKGRELLKEHQLGALLITRGEHGMTLIREKENEVHVPTQAKEVFDVTGAGDTVIATFATAVASGSPLDEAMRLANVAAGLSVGKLGASVVTVPELRRALRSKKANVSGVLTVDQLQLMLEEAKAHGEKVVFTNGCFDILHAGHMLYLREAKSLGDRLIVAVNSDESVKKLKGPGRPVNSLEKRMAVLAGVGVVDWVVSFSDDTPIPLLKALQPDVLVKGGDYTKSEVVGGDIVETYGGEVKVLGVLEGESTTNLINKIHQSD